MIDLGPPFIFVVFFDFHFLFFLDFFCEKEYRSVLTSNFRLTFKRAILRFFVTIWNLKKTTKKKLQINPFLVLFFYTNQRVENRNENNPSRKYEVTVMEEIG